jgi:transposase
VNAATREELNRKAQARAKSLREEFEALVRDGRHQELTERAITMLDKALREVDRLTWEQAASRFPRTSEKIDPAQLLLKLAELSLDEQSDAKSGVELDTDSDDDNTLVDEPEDEDATPENQKPKPKRRGRNPLPPGLPRDIVNLTVPEGQRVCGTCGNDKVCIGHESSEQLELVPAHFKVVEYRREKLACRTCKDGVDMADAAPKLIERGLPGPGLLAHLVTSKFADHLPLYRLARLYKRLGVAIARSTLGFWAGRVATELEPVIDLMWQDLMSSPLVHADATGMPVLDCDEPDGKRMGTMWAHAGRSAQFDVAVFKYAPNGSGDEGPWKNLAGRQGYLVVDAANVFDRCFNGRVADAVKVACWTHARRNFHDILETEPRAAIPLKLIADLYRVERLVPLKGLDNEAHLAERTSKSARIIDKLKAWRDKMHGREPPASGFAKAIAYLVNHWDALTVFLKDARVPLDNTFCEQQIRSLAVGRRNYLFVGADSGGERAATHYSIMRTCALNGVDPVDYLVDVLGKLAAGWPNSRLAELTPYGWAKAQKVAQESKPEP